MNWFDVLKRGRRIPDPRKGRKGLSPEQQKKYGFKTATKTKEQREAELARVREEDRRDKEAQIPPMLNAIENAIYSSHSNKIIKVIDRAANWFEEYLERHYSLSEEEFYEKEMKDWHRGEWGTASDTNTVEQAEKEAKEEKEAYSRRKESYKTTLNELQALDVNKVVAVIAEILTENKYKYIKKYHTILKEEKAKFDAIMKDYLEPFYEFKGYGNFGIRFVFHKAGISGVYDRQTLYDMIEFIGDEKK